MILVIEITLISSNGKYGKLKLNLHEQESEGHGNWVDAKTS